MKVRCHPEAGRDILLYSCDTWLTKADADICLSFIIRPQMHFILRWIESHTFACTFALSSFFHIVLFALLTPCSSMPIVGIDVYRQWLNFAVDRIEKNQFRPELIHSNILHVQAILYYRCKQWKIPLLLLVTAENQIEFGAAIERNEKEGFLRSSCF